MLGRRFVAEFLGTFILVFLAVGAAVSGIAAKVGVDALGPGAGVLGVAIAFGFVLIFVAYAFGPVSGAHVNPAVTLGLLVARKIDPKTAGVHVVAQVCGALVGAALLKLLVTSFAVKDQTGNLGSNGYGTTIDMGGAFILEVVLTLVFVLVILLVTDKAATAGAAGLAIGACLTVDPPGRHPADRHLGEPGPLARGGAVRRRRRPRSAVAVRGRPAGRRGAGRAHLPVHPPARTRHRRRPQLSLREPGGAPRGGSRQARPPGGSRQARPPSGSRQARPTSSRAGLSRSRSGVRPGRIGPWGSGPLDSAADRSAASGAGRTSGALAPPDARSPPGRPGRRSGTRHPLAGVASRDVRGLCACAPGPRPMSGPRAAQRPINVLRSAHQHRAPHQRPDPRPRGPPRRSQRRAGRHRPHRGGAASSPRSPTSTWSRWPHGTPPVCKLMDYGKFKYENAPEGP